MEDASVTPRERAEALHDALWPLSTDDRDEGDLRKIAAAIAAAEREAHERAAKVADAQAHQHRGMVLDAEAFATGIAEEIRGLTGKAGTEGKG